MMAGEEKERKHRDGYGKLKHYSFAPAGSERHLLIIHVVHSIKSRKRILKYLEERTIIRFNDFFRQIST